MEGGGGEEERQRDGKSWFVEHMLTKAKTSMKQYHGGFLNCYLLSESCMHVLLLLLKYGEVAAYLWLHGLWSQLDIGCFQLCKHQARLAGDLCSS